MQPIELVDFDKCQKNLRFYGGMSGDKYGIDYNNEPYILKFPQNTRNFKLMNHLSYSNNSYSEFIGSHFYEYVGIPAHKTLLGTARNHIVIACKDFCLDEYVLIEFAKLANAANSESGNMQIPSSGHEDRTTILRNVLNIIETLDVLAPLRSKIKERFWDMFVIDAIIANPDRNSGNWGVLNPVGSRKPEALTLAPVFDNGNSLNCKISDETIKESSSKEITEISLKVASVFQRINEKGEAHRINPYLFIKNLSNNDCNKAVVRLAPRIQEALKKINELIEALPGISDERKAFYSNSMVIRYKNSIFPAYKELSSRKIDRGLSR